VIHHGGAGTVHMALKHGIPQLIIPHLLDQYYWAETIKTLKIGANINLHNLNQRKVEKFIDRMVNTQEYYNKSKSLSKMFIENGFEEFDRLCL
jgi:sterol 3beta-glucosyltransferase